MGKAIKKKLVVVLAVLLTASNCMYASAAPISGTADIVVLEEQSENSCGEDCLHGCGDDFGNDDCGHNHCETDGCVDECYQNGANEEDEVSKETDSEDVSSNENGSESISEKIISEEETSEKETSEEETSEIENEDEEVLPEDSGLDDEDLTDTYNNFTYTSNGSAITITKYNGTESTVVIPDTINGLPVQTIGQEAFSENLSVRSVTIPSSVTKIGTGAFNNCQNMSTLILNEGLQNIGNQAFKYCFALKSVVIPSTVTSVGTSAFEQCTNLTTVELKGSYIAAQMFYNCVALSSVSIPSNVIFIGNGAFMNCISMTSATIEAKAAIGNNAFDGCSSLSMVSLKNVTKIGNASFARSGITSVTIPSSVTYIDGKAFYECEKLSSVTMNEGVNTIRAQAFQNCTALKEITLPSTLVSVYTEVFRGCSALESVNIKGSYIGGRMFQDCTSLKEITIPSCVGWVGDYAFFGCTALQKADIKCSGTIATYVFDGCTGLTEVDLSGATVNTIDEGAFRNTGITGIVIPSTVKSVKSNAFYNCSALKTAKFMGNTPVVFGSGVFDGADSAFEIQYYEGKTGWTTPTWNGYKTKMLSAHVHNLTHVQAKTATCLSAGNIEYWYCDSCKSYFSDAEALTEISEADTVTKPLGHNMQEVAGSAKDATCTKAGKKADQKCSRCTLLVEGETIAALGHDYQTVSGSAKAATCEENGKEADQKCSHCGDIIAGTTIEKLGHDMQIVEGSAKDATCTETGKTSDRKCSRCDYKIEGMTIEALGHAWDAGVVTKEATETEEGVMTYTCRRCRNTRTEVIPKQQHVHNLTHFVRKSATCTESGNLEYWYCDKCGNYYLDANANNKITKENTIIEAHGHNYQEVAGSAKAATCTEAGKNANQKCSYCNDIIEGTVIDALGHNWDQGVVTKAPTEQEEGERTYTCGRCHATHVDPIAKLAHVHNLLHVNAKAAKCEEAGNLEYWHCGSCDSYFSDAAAATEVLRESLILPATGHDWDDGTVILEPTEEMEGSRRIICRNCQSSYTEVIPKLEHVHNLSHAVKKAASCTENGNIEYWYCSKCDSYFKDKNAKNKVTKAATVIAAFGHDYQVVAGSARNASCTEAGKTADKKCRHCGDIISGTVIEAPGHDWDDGVITKTPTEDEEGELTYTCKRCQGTYVKPIDKLEKKDKVTDLFDDVKEGAWYVSAIQFVYDRGIMTGKGSGFAPDGKLKREEFVQTLYSLSGKPDVPKSTANPFKDVKKEQWFASAILWANSNGYVAGNKDGTFGVGNNIQREALVSILYKYAAANGYDMSYDAGAITGYADTKKVSSWAKNAFCWAVSKGIISGKGAKGETDKSKIKLDPAGNASRAECAAMLMRLLEMNH